MKWMVVAVAVAAVVVMMCRRKANPCLIMLMVATTTMITKRTAMATKKEVPWKGGHVLTTSLLQRTKQEHANNSSNNKNNKKQSRHQCYDESTRTGSHCADPTSSRSRCCVVVTSSAIRAGRIGSIPGTAIRAFVRYAVKMLARLPPNAAVAMIRMIAAAGPTPAAVAATTATIIPVAVDVPDRTGEGQVIDDDPEALRMRP
mmetsp:Transcript_5769/g.17139  ORF Transcript_5769/g.17139 Transcript_5769/m.17139 type:complete len:202 (-) Transcript_5769:561-1166(-)